MQFIELLLDRGVFKKAMSWIWETTDGCAKQYIYATALYLLSSISQKYNIVIVRAICAPGHGKGCIDSQNGIDKNLLKRAMCYLLNPEEDVALQESLHDFDMAELLLPKKKQRTTQKKRKTKVQSIM